MTSENDNPAEAGTENANPSTADTSYDTDYYDPDEDQDNVEASTAGETDSEVDDGQEAESDDEPEADEDGQSEEDKPEGESDEEPDEKAKDDIKVTMQDGSELSLDELKSGYMKQSDYSRKTMQTAEQAKAVSAQAERITRTVEAFAEFLSGQIPDEPPVSLSITDPQAYVQQKAAHEATMAQINALIAFGHEPKAVKGELDTKDQQARLHEENEALASAFPETTKPEGRKAFFDSAFNAARELGYSDTETKNVTDHRLLGLAYWANKGMAADKARKAAKTKVQDVPPVVPTRRPKAVSQVAQNKDAMRRLSKTGSIQDAMLVDWD